MAGRKRRFGIAGLVNILLTNLILQVLLLIPALPASVCTLISQAWNGAMGYIIYGKWVFRASGLREGRSVLRYSLTQGLLWFLNWGIISVGVSAGVNRNITALLGVPILAVISYTIQKYWIFLPR